MHILFDELCFDYILIYVDSMLWCVLLICVL